MSKKRKKAKATKKEAARQRRSQDLLDAVAAKSADDIAAVSAETDGALEDTEAAEDSSVPPAEESDASPSKETPEADTAQAEASASNAKNADAGDADPDNAGDADDADTDSEPALTEEGTPETGEPEKRALLEISGLRISFWSRGRWVHAVDGANLTLGEGEGLAIIGESGSGKTLTMMSSLALIPGWPGPVGGQIRYRDDELNVGLLDGVDDAYEVTEKHVKDAKSAVAFRRDYIRRARLLAGRKIGIIFQNPIASLDPLWSVGGTLIESIKLRAPELSRKEAKEEAIDWLERVHIKNPVGVMRSYPHQLSGGMCQRVMIASTLAMRPRIIIADEPTTGLDMTTKAQILYLLHEARKMYGSSLIFVTHEIGLAAGLTEKVAVMRHGRVVDQFPTDALSDVTVRDGELHTSHTFHEHTQALLKASLRLERG